MVPEKVFLRPLSPFERAVLLLLYSLEKGGVVVYPSQRYLMAKVGISKKAFYKVLSSLEKKGLIRREKKASKIYLCVLGGKKVFIPKEFMHYYLHPKERGYLSLLLALKGKELFLFTTLDILRYYLGVCKKTVQLNLEKLKQQKLIEKQKWGHGIQITILFPPIYHR